MEKYPTILNILESGFGPDLARTLLDGIQQYGTALALGGDSVGIHDGENLCNMVWLLKAVLKDCCGVDVE